MIGRRHLLCSDERREERNVDGSKDREMLGNREHRGGPGERLKRRAVIVRVATVAFPTSDRQEEIHSGFIEQQRQADVVVPRRRPPLRHRRHVSARRTIRAEKSELQRVLVVHRVASRTGPRLKHRRGFEGPPCYPCGNGVRLMKITRVEPILIAVPYTHGGPKLERVFGPGDRMGTLLVRIDTDAGITGWGESFGLSVSPVTQAALAHILASGCRARSRRYIRAHGRSIERYRV